MNWLRITLAAFCLAMLAVIGEELASEGAEPGRANPPAPRPAPAAAEAVPGFKMPPSNAFAEILARPLFSPTRRPGIPAGPLPLSSSFTLVAIVIAPRDRHALLGSGQPLKVVRVTEGEEVAGWTVDKILLNAVLVRRGDVREEVKPKDSAQAAAGNSASVASVVSQSRKVAPPHRRAHDE